MAQEIVTYTPGQTTHKDTLDAQNNNAQDAEARLSGIENILNNMGDIVRFNFRNITTVEYSALNPPDPNTIYNITDA